MRIFILAATAFALTACAAVRDQTHGTATTSTNWRAVITSNDLDRTSQWRTAFTSALAKARGAGHGADIDREGPLLQPDVSLGPTPIPNGNYKCRIIKLGAKGEGNLDYIAYPAFDCRIQQEGELQGFAKLNGSQRQVGLIFPDSALRQMFLGTLVLGDEQRAMQYGRDADRDVVGWVERVGDNRWRIVMPYPHFESTLDVMELVPAS